MRDQMVSKLPPDLARTFKALEADNAKRDTRHAEVASARRGDVESILPGVFPQSWPKPIVANVINTTAEDLARVLARIPTVDCASGNMTSERAKLFAAKRTKIALHYLDRSRVKKQLHRGADWYFSFGAMPIIVEPDFEEQTPTMRFDDPRGAYWRTNHFGEVSVYIKTWQESVGALAAKFPEFQDQIRNTNSQFDQKASDDSTLKVGRMYTRKGTYLFLPDRGNLLLRAAPQPLGKVPVEVAELPSWDEQTRGRFDDVLWVWLARARMALYGMEAAHKSIHAPLAVPPDVQRIPLGPDALIRSQEAEKIRRVPIDLPQASLIESQLLDAELQKGSAYPQARQGTLDASIITGKGVEALSGVFSTQIAAAQDDVGDAMRRALMLSFEMDELFWPNGKKTMTGMSNGAPFTDTYVPSRDIKGEHTVSVSYGFTAGMDPNRALVFLLQLRGDRAIDRDTLQRQLPFETDTVQLNQSIDIEEMEDALKQGLYGLSSQLPMMAQQGMDPSATLQKIARIVKDRKGGKAMYEAVLEAFTPEPQPQTPADPMQAAMAEAGLGGAGGGEPSPEGLGPAQMMGGGTGDIMQMLAGLTSRGGANLQANVSRRTSAQ